MIKLMDMHPKILGARFTIHIDLKILSGLEFDRAMIKVIKAGLATVTPITVGDYCSMTPGVLQLPPHLSRVHDVFLVSQLRHCFKDPIREVDHEMLVYNMTFLIESTPFVFLIP